MRKATSSGMPQISTAMNGWTKKIRLIKLKEKVVDGFVKNEQIEVRFDGAIQPLSDRELALKPEGQRSWTWLQIHVRSLWINFIPDDRIVWNGDKYKIYAVKDYSLNGYVEYHAVRDFQDGGSE